MTANSEKIIGMNGAAGAKPQPQQPQLSDWQREIIAELGMIAEKVAADELFCLSFYAVSKSGGVKRKNVHDGTIFGKALLHDGLHRQALEVGTSLEREDAIARSQAMKAHQQSGAAGGARDEQEAKANANDRPADVPA